MSDESGDMNERDERDDLGEPEVGDEERREAEALAQALERGHAAQGLPEDALQTAALLRHAAGGSARSSARAQAGLEEVLAAADRVAARRPEEPPAAPWWRWLLGLAGASAAVAAVLLLVLRDPGPVEPTALPAPDPALLTAQMERLASGAPAAPDAALERAMRSYRGRVYAALSERYGAR
jgi:hypothetical protein